jgi:hypothetical protein
MLVEMKEEAQIELLGSGSPTRWAPMHVRKPTDIVKLVTPLSRHSDIRSLR